MPSARPPRRPPRHRLVLPRLPKVAASLPVCLPVCLALGLFLVLASCIPVSVASAQGLDQRIVTRPAPQPVEDEPFELVFLGEWFYFFDEGGPQPAVTIEEGTITVTVRARFPVFLPPQTSYAIPVEMPALPAGEYEVRLLVDDASGDPEELDRGTLEIRKHRAGVEPVVAPLLAGESARIRVFADPDPLNVFSRDAVQVREGTIFIEAVFDTGIITPPPPLFAEQVVETPPLDAGLYDIVVIEAFGAAAVGLGELEVLPAPTLQDGRFDLALQWTDSTGASGPGRPVVQADDSVLYHFFGGDNWELMAKVLDGCDLNGHYWVFIAASTNVAWKLQIEDRATGTEWVGTNALGERSPAMADVTAFACDAASAADPFAPATAPAVSAVSTVSVPDVSEPPAKTHLDGWVESAAVTPFLVSDRQDAALWVWGGSPRFGDMPEIQSVDIERESRTVEVRFSPPADRPFDPVDPRDRKVELGRLDAGFWQVSLVEAGDEGEVSLLETSFHVREGFEILSPVDTFAQPIATRALDLAVVGPGERCPFLELVDVEAAGAEGERGRIHLAIRESEVCNTLVPPGPFQVALRIGRLDAGLYDAVLTRPGAEGRIEFERQIEVLPDPLRVGDSRYEMTVRWTDFAGLSGTARPAIPPSEDSALYWFFGPENWELMVKVLDGCEINSHVWVFGAASTHVEYTIEVLDTVSGEIWTYTNPLGETSPAITDVQAFACGPR